jgi:NADH:ubiquinone oxidoreductase subunit E
MSINTLVSQSLKPNELETLIDETLKKNNSESNSPLIPILQEIQHEEGYLSTEALRLVSEKTGASPSHVFGVATFYHQFRLRPEGKHQISICRGTACHVAGATDLYKTIVKELGLTPSEDTSEDGLFTLHVVRCIGACSLAPVIKVDDTAYGKMTPKKLRVILNQYRGDEK